MTDSNDKPVILKQRERRKFSRDDKQRLCKQWQASGLTKHKFCIQNDLVLSALNRWCQKFLCETSAKNTNWVPVVKPDKPGNTLQSDLPLVYRTPELIYLMQLKGCSNETSKNAL